MDNSKKFQFMLEQAIESEPLVFKSFDRTKNVQDQLQKMVFGTGQYGARQIVNALWDACKLNGSLVPREELGIPKIGTTDKKWSMEQLWLAFVMKENYSKVWDGEDWIIEVT